MKVLFVNEYASPVSGAEYSQLELARAVEAEVFSPEWLKNKSGKGVSPLWFNNPLYYFYSAWQISREKFDLIHRGFFEISPAGESFAMVEKRVQSFIDDLIPLVKNEKVNVAISAHGNSIRLFRKIMENASVEETCTWTIPYDDYYEYEI